MLGFIGKARMTKSSSFEVASNLSCHQSLHVMTDWIISSTRNCLGLIYTVYSERMVGSGGEPIRLETLVGNLLSLVSVPAAGQPGVRFSLGANDRQLLQSPVYPEVQK